MSIGGWVVMWVLAGLSAHALVCRSAFREFGWKADIVVPMLLFTFHAMACGPVWWVVAVYVRLDGRRKSI